MKRVTLFFLFLVYLGLHTANGQWTTDGDDIYNSNAGNVGIGHDSPSYLLHVGKNMTEPTITINNLSGFGGATFQMIDDGSSGNWKFKSTTGGGFKIRDHQWGLDVIKIQENSMANAISIKTGGNIGIGTNTPDNSAILDISSTLKGLLITRMTGDQRDLIPNPADGLLVYVTDDSTFYVYAKSEWIPLLSSAGPYTDWTVSDDTLYSVPDSTVAIKDGKVGIGITTPQAMLDVDGSFRANTVNTGHGNCELYDMDQDVTSTSTPVFVNLSTGHGYNELFAMDQHVQSTNSVSFVSINTGHGYNELYDMNQNVTTSSNPTFNRVHLSDYGTAPGGFHIGGTSDPLTDNLVVDGESTLTGGIITGESASGETTRFGTKKSTMADVNPIVTCRSGYFWWDYSENKVKFTETNAHNGFARFSGQKNEGGGATVFDGIASYESTATVATLDSNLEYVTVEVTSEGSDGGYIHLYCMYSNFTFVAHYWFRYK
jgi:hypothetical protein